MTSQRRIRLFLDSNVLTGGIVSRWGLDKAALSLCAARLCKLVLAEIVRDEVEENLLLHAERLPSLEADELIEHYRRLVKLTNPEMVPDPAEWLVRSSRHLIRNAADAAQDVPFGARYNGLLEPQGIALLFLTPLGSVFIILDKGPLRDT